MSIEFVEGVLYLALTEKQALSNEWYNIVKVNTHNAPNYLRDSVGRVILKG